MFGFRNSAKVKKPSADDAAPSLTARVSSAFALSLYPVLASAPFEFAIISLGIATIVVWLLLDSLVALFAKKTDSTSYIISNAIKYSQRFWSTFAFVIIITSPIILFLAAADFPLFPLMYITGIVWWLIGLTIFTMKLWKKQKLL